MAEASCNCGAVRFGVDEPFTGVYVCHCSICRRSTGTNGNAVLVVPNECFRWLGGQASISTWRKPGHDWQIWFCQTCGSQLPGENSATTMFIPAGLIADADLPVPVVHHIWVNSKAGWDEIGDRGKQHPEAFEGSP